MKQQTHKPIILFLSYDQRKESLQRYVMEVSDQLKKYSIVASDIIETATNAPLYTIAEEITVLVEQSTIVVVLAGVGANRPEGKWDVLNAVNKMDYELRKAIELGKDILAVRIQPDGVVPVALHNQQSILWIPKFSIELIANELEGRKHPLIPHSKSK